MKQRLADRMATCMFALCALMMAGVLIALLLSIFVSGASR